MDRGRRPRARSHARLRRGRTDFPSDRLWRLVEDESVSILGLSPTLVRALIPHGDPDADLTSLRTIVTTGEPWNPEPYRWLFEQVGGSRCSDHQLLRRHRGRRLLPSPTPAMPIKACSLGGPALGMAMDVVDAEGESVVGTGEVGELVCRKPFPGMTRGFWRDPERYIETYWSRFPGVWTHGDWASVDEDGYWFLHGRSDDTLNIAGKRVGPAELESAAVAHPAVAEAAAVGVPHDVKGEVAWLFCALVPGRVGDEELASDVAARVARTLVRRSGRSACCSCPHCRRRGAPRSYAEPRAKALGRDRATCRRWRTPRHWRRSQMPSELEGQVALVTGGGRGVGANVAREPARAGMRVAVSARSTDQVEEVAREIGGLAVVADVSTRQEVDAMVAKVESELGPVDLLVANAGIALWERSAWEVEPADWWRSTKSTCSASPVLPGGDPGDDRARPWADRAHGERGRVPARFEVDGVQLEQGGRDAVRRDARPPAGALWIGVFPISPGLVRTEMTEDAFPDDAPWTPPEAAPRLVRELATGRFDALSGRYLHAEHDSDELERRIDAILSDDLNAIRLRR